MKDMFLFRDKVDLYADCCDCNLLDELWHSFSGKKSNLNVLNGEKNKISIGDALFTPLEYNDEYTLNVSNKGVGIQADTKAGLLRGFMMLIMCIEQVSEKELGIPCCEIHGNFSIKNRMIHLCVFPETTFSAFKKQVRLCGVLQYTHIIIEFWGMLKYDSLKELSWEFGFEKDTVRDLIDEIRKMGMQPIPMFNHLGHASQCRVKNGKHTVLDQNPKLGYLFSPDGWAWNICSNEASTLLKKVRYELYDLFGEGNYIHLGCDEAYIYGNGYIKAEELRDYLGKITAEVVSEGRRPIIWGDMLVSPNEINVACNNYYCAASETETAELLRSKISKETVIADWQYDVTEGRLETAVFLKSKGFDVVACPWFEDKNIDVCVDTAKEDELFGVMETTWNTLSEKMPSILYCARKYGLPNTRWSKYAHIYTETATLLRKVSEHGRSYENCGFTHHQIGEKND